MSKSNLRPWLTVVIIVAVDVPLGANVKEAIGELYNNIRMQRMAHVDAFLITAGDFHQTSLKSVLPKFYQHVNFATRGNNTLDHRYTNIKHLCRAAPLPHTDQQLE